MVLTPLTTDDINVSQNAYIVNTSYNIFLINTNKLRGDDAVLFPKNSIQSAFFLIQSFGNQFFVTIWSHRLMVRTPGFHPGNPGSIPGEITKEDCSLNAS